MKDWKSKVYGTKNSDERYFSSKKWLNLREKVLNRDNHKCKACGVAAGLTVHHIIPRADGGKDILKTLKLYVKAATIS